MFLTLYAHTWAKYETIGSSEYAVIKTLYLV